MGRAPRLGFHLTDRCQLDCQHCLRDPEKTARDLPFDLFIRILDQGRTLYGIRSVSFTGGEPTLHPQFLDIVRAVAERQQTWDMVTNGRRLPWVLEAISREPELRASLRLLSVSLDGAERETHDEIRGAGSYAEVMQAISSAVAHGVPFGIQCALHRKNVHELERLGLLAAQLGAKHVSFALLQPTGTPHDAALFLSAEAWRSVYRRLEALSRALSIRVIAPEGHWEPARFSVCEPFQGETLHVDVDGNLSLCCMHSGVPAVDPSAGIAGSLAELSLTEAHGKLLQLIADAQRADLERLHAPDTSSWDAFPCNRCLARFGRPHWTEEGASGPAAHRERWHGAWSKDFERDPVTGVSRLRLVGT
jgi:MoaA/NifB/PqqE/SkfB family radical SAM enzyme